MLKPFKFDTTKNPLLFWSDLHFGHDREFLWGRRGFKNVEEHDKYIISTLNAKSNNNTNLILLGDNIFGPNGMERFKVLLNSIPFRNVYLMPGNHHAGYKQLYCSVLGENNPEMDQWPLSFKLQEHKIVTFIPNYFEIYVDTHNFVVLCHYPVRCWNQCAKGSIMLCGHSHGNYEKTKIETTYGGKTLDIGLENCIEPLFWHEIMSEMNKRPIVAEDHHGE